MSTKIYIVSAFSMEPYSETGFSPRKAFYTRKEAEEFVKNHPDTYDADPEEHDYGWAYSTYIQEITLEGEKNG